MKRIIVAIDGYSACGKSTTAQATARILGYRYIDSGAMYRAVTLYFIENQIDINNLVQVEYGLKNCEINFKVNSHGKTVTYLNCSNVEKRIRDMDISQFVSQVSSLPVVRHSLVEQQRNMGNAKAIVMDGRDIGTVVFPDSEVKFFMTANIEVRAKRRQMELLERNEIVDIELIKENILKRDAIDSSRTESPLLRAKDAINLDTTHISIDEEIDEVVRVALSKILA